MSDTPNKNSVVTMTIWIIVAIMIVILLIIIGCVMKQRRRGAARRRGGVEAGLKQKIGRPTPYNAPIRKLPHGPRPTIPPRTSSRQHPVPVHKHATHHLPTNPKVGPRPMLPPGAIVRQAGRPVPPMKGPPPSQPLPAPPQRAKLSLKTNFGPTMGRNSPVSPMTRKDWAYRGNSVVSPM
ncbi:uncharacterized protein AB675_8077 [Cyphellophora attinorum]|uniref:Uncharacterized protein n=1 Tax=Cyphellophora attinorum TaxID=1664694 RepID=A0A0N1HV18_9EURO|nr:uncharacterized protein AB675_8077 [Phialophora attinorum]KPI40987.1 hypothetical protein AB675_8077 [Phialophora attinorum]